MATEGLATPIAGSVYVALINNVRAADELKPGHVGDRSATVAGARSDGNRPAAASALAAA